MHKIFYILLIIIAYQYPAQEQNAVPQSVSYTGWWVYGEGQHIFKEETTLQEWVLHFPNENIEELENLYLEITEMEYLPMECIMFGTVNTDTLLVDNFEITYIQGCDE